MTYDFVMGQLRLIAVGLFSFAIGKGWITSTDATQLQAILYPAGLLAAPVLWSWWTNWQKKVVPHDSVAIQADVGTPTQVLGNGIAIQGGKIVGALLAFMFVAPAFAADIPVKNTATVSLPKSVACQVAGDCSGFYGTFGVGINAALGATLTDGSAANNGERIDFGGGYQLWKGQVLAGVEITGGYQFGSAGNTGSATSTQFVKLGYNFFPATGTAPASPSQNPLNAFVPATLLQNSTPALLFGGAYGHGIEKAAIGFEVDTVVAAGWSTAFQWYNAPSVKGQADENVFRVMVQKHF